MHALVYFALTHGVFSRKHASECASPVTFTAPRGFTAAAAEAVTTAGSGLRTTAGKISLGGGGGVIGPAAQLAGSAMGPDGDVRLGVAAEALAAGSLTAGAANVLQGTGRLVAAKARRLARVWGH